jgi:hypothetical protein
MSKRYLTKSRFKLAVECPTKLFYTSKQSVYKNSKHEDSFLRMLADGGFQVGQLAKIIFKDAYEVDATDSKEALAKTKKLLAENENITLLEPAIVFENLLVRIDVLIKRNNTFELIEVKAKSYNSNEPEIEGKKVPILKEMLPYIQDVAFQKYVLSKAYPNATISTYLMLPDKAIKSTIDGLNQMFKVENINHQTKVIVDERIYSVVNEAEKLLAKVSVDKLVNIVLENEIYAPGFSLPMEELSKTLAKAYEIDTKLAPRLTSACSTCEFKASPKEKLNSGFHECLQEVTKWPKEELYQSTVLDIWDFRKKTEFLELGVYKPSQLTQEDIKYKDDKEGLSRTQRQWLQCQGIPLEEDKGGFYFDAELFNHHMSKWKYPYHMIDFETSTTALPFFKGMQPYESVAFQFSHHIMSQDGSIKHSGEFILAEAGQFPNYEFLRALKNQLEGDDGTVFRWAAHENTILNHIAHQLESDLNPPQDKDALLEFVKNLTTGGARAMVDLNEIAKRTYYHPDTKARTSIKKILPAVLKSSAYLKKKYEQPIYGKEIPSINFKDFTWWQHKDGEFVEPYDLLKDIENEMLGDEGADIFDTEDEGFEIAEGGAAAAAFARLQFECLSDQQRSNIKNALLRYCELDTLAMVMIVEAWKNWSSA